MANKCVKINFSWENKGILLGLIFYILKRYNFFRKRLISIDNHKLKNILAYLFNDLDFVNDGAKFHINVKNSERDGVVINNINNLSQVQAKRVYLLPWYDKDNAIVMYFHNPAHTYDINKFKQEVKAFSKCDRGKNYGARGFIGNCYGMNVWDNYAEYAILSQYAAKFPMFDVVILYKLISDYLINDICYRRVERQIYQVPVPVAATRAPVYVPMMGREDERGGRGLGEIMDEDKLQKFERLLERMTPEDVARVRGESNKPEGVAKINENEHEHQHEQISVEDRNKYSRCLEIIDKITNKVKRTNELLDMK